MAHQYRIIDTCPCPKLIAPYIAITLEQAKAEAVSIWRGDDKLGQALENKYGHHSQAQLFDASPAERIEWGVMGTPDRPGTSSHEGKSDGVAFPHIPVGHDLERWMQGFDVNGGDEADACIRGAARFGWVLFRPYSSGAEVHHLCFKVEPKPRNLRMKARVIRVRATLPRS